MTLEGVKTPEYNNTENWRIFFVRVDLLLIEEIRKSLDAMKKPEKQKMVGEEKRYVFVSSNFKMAEQNLKFLRAFVEEFYTK